MRDLRARSAAQGEELEQRSVHFRDRCEMALNVGVGMVSDSASNKYSAVAARINQSDLGHRNVDDLSGAR